MKFLSIRLGCFASGLLVFGFLLVPHPLLAQVAPFVDAFVQDGRPQSTRSIAFAPDGKILVLSSTHVLRYDGQTGVFQDTLLEVDPERILFSNSFALGKNNLLYLNRSNDFRVEVVRFDALTGAFVDTFLTTHVTDDNRILWRPALVRVGEDGHLYVNNFHVIGRGWISQFDGNTAAFMDTVAFESSDEQRYFHDFTFGLDGEVNTWHEDYVYQHGKFPQIVLDSLEATDTAWDMVWGREGNLHVSFASNTVNTYDGLTGDLINTFDLPANNIAGPPYALHVAPDGLLYISTYISKGNIAEVHRYDVTTWEYKGPLIDSKNGGLDGPFGLVSGPDNHLYVASFHDSSNQILRYDGNSGDFIDAFVPSNSAGLDQPFDVVFGPDEHLYISSFGSDKILRYDGSTGEFIDAFITEGLGGLDGPGGIAFGPDERLYVASVLTDEILRYDGDTGAFIDVVVSAQSGGLDAPHGIVFGPDEALYVGSYHTDSILKYNGDSGEFVEVFVETGSGGLDAPQDHIFGPDGHLYVSSLFTDTVLRYDGLSGDFLDVYASASESSLNGPRGLLFDTEGRLYVSSFDNDTILRYASTRYTSRINPIQIPADSPINAVLFPNPASQETTLGFSLPKPGEVAIEVFDLLGRKKLSLDFGMHMAGDHHISIDISGLVQGRYVARISFDDRSENIPMMIIR